MFRFYFVILPTNLMIKIKINKKMSENLTSVQLQEYYRDKLNKKEKSSLLKYLMIEFDYSYASIQGKMSGQLAMNKRDEILIGEVIREESWRQ